MANINELLDGHVTLELECLDRLYLNGYVEELVMGGQLRRFLMQQLGKPYPSPPGVATSRRKNGSLSSFV
jgi:hypothetical protein